MTDGPFRNAVLSGAWKRYGRNLSNDACSLNDRAVQACRSIVGDIQLKEVNALLSDLKSLAQRSQMDLDPSASIEAIFARHTHSPLTDTIERYFAVQILDGASLGNAIDKVVQRTVSGLIEEAKERMIDECASARDKGDISLKEYSKLLDRNAETFNAATGHHDLLCQALFEGRKVLKSVSRKKDGLEDGPEE